MKPGIFRQPVIILFGLGFPVEVKTVMDVYRDLTDWPTSFRDTTHTVPLRACKAAIDGEIEAETARGLFTAFAKKHDLIAPETYPASVARRRSCNSHAR